MKKRHGYWSAFWLYDAGAGDVGDEGRDETDLVEGQ
jgi:hypothetical protein